MSTPIREFPAAEPRVETGPIAFGEDWPGLFIRGDNVFAYYKSLLILLAAVKTLPQAPAFTIAHLQGLVSDLQSCLLHAAANEETSHE